MSSWQIIALMLCGSLVFASGCSDDPDENGDQTDTGIVEDVDVGGGGDTDEPEQDVDEGEEDVDPGECTEFCEDSPVTIESADGEFPFTQAAYGFTSPAWTDGGWELHVELWEDGFEGCPEQDSPSPSRTLILSGLSLDDSDELVLAEQLGLTLLDFDGLVFVEDKEIPFIRAVSVQAQGESWEFCTACLTDSSAEGKNDDLVVRLAAEFEKGSLRGEMRAKYCESMNEL